MFGQGKASSRMKQGHQKHNGTHSHDTLLHENQSPEGGTFIDKAHDISYENLEHQIHVDDVEQDTSHGWNSTEPMPVNP